MAREKPIKAGQTKNRSLNFIFFISTLLTLGRRPTVACMKFLPSLQPTPNSNIQDELPLSCCVGTYFPEAFGIAACVPVMRETGVTSGLGTISEEAGVYTEVVTELGG